MASNKIANKAIDIDVEPEQIGDAAAHPISMVGYEVSAHEPS